MKLRRIRRWARRGVLGSAAVVVAGAVALVIAWVALPFPAEGLDRWPASPVVTDSAGGTLLMRVSGDDQWSAPVSLDEVSPWLVQATVAVEDERFFTHPGVDPIAVVRAAGQNVAAGRVVSGASTLTMQVCRMIEDRPRTLRAKAIEAVHALQLERMRDKRQILAAYLNMAPYGGNIRGASAAARIYFARRPADLTLGESALLAGLPQAPSRFRPDRHLRAALKRRRIVLGRMVELGMIGEAQRAVAADEPVTIRPRRRVLRAPHAAQLALQRRPRGGRTTIDAEIQARVERAVADHARPLPAGSQVAVVAIDIDAAAIVAMVGSLDPDDPLEGQVNGATARRSPGSALKPFIYAAAFEAGRLNGEAIVYDVEIQRAGWSPKNFDRTFSGPVPAAEALRRSLNVPAILVTEAIGIDRCIGLMSSAGADLPAGARARGGLALAVGAIEVTLLELTNAYATLGRRGVHCPPRLFADEPILARRAIAPNVCAAVGEILSTAHRRPRGMQDLRQSDVPWFMWKTGTSAGRRDAWALGHNRRFALGVWVGRFEGTGRVAYVGAEAAEPLLARLMALGCLRNDRPPAPGGPIVVRHPIAPPAPLAPGPKILAPSAGDTFVAIAGKALVRPRANRPGQLAWFLNGRLLPAGRSARLELDPGGYELRCVDPAGRASAVRFCVR